LPLFQTTKKKSICDGARWKKHAITSDSNAITSDSTDVLLHNPLGMKKLDSENSSSESRLHGLFMHLDYSKTSTMWSIPKL